MQQHGLRAVDGKVLSRFPKTLELSHRVSIIVGVVGTFSGAIPRLFDLVQEATGLTYEEFETVEDPENRNSGAIGTHVRVVS